MYMMWGTYLARFSIFTILSPPNGRWKWDLGLGRRLTGDLVGVIALTLLAQLHPLVAPRRADLRPEKHGEGTDRLGVRLFS